MAHMDNLDELFLNWRETLINSSDWLLEGDDGRSQLYGSNGGLFGRRDNWIINQALKANMFGWR